MSESLNLPLVVEPDELEKLLGHTDLLLIDLSSPDTYSRAHVPGAIFVPFQHTMRGVPPVAGGLPAQRFQGVQAAVIHGCSTGHR